MCPQHQETLYLDEVCSEEIGTGFAPLVLKLQKIFEGSLSPSEAMTAVLHVLNQFSDKSLRLALEATINDDQVMAQIAGRSYLHGNGFYKIIITSDQAFKLRLHIWMPGTSAEENLHDHRWHFASKVLTGSLHSEIWEDSVKPQAAGYKDYIYYGRQDLKEESLEPVGNAHISLKNTIYHNAGDSYIMFSNTMHRIVSSGDFLTSTLMCHSSPIKNWARVIAFGEVVPEVEHLFLTPAQLKDVLKKYLIALESESLV